MPVRGGDGLIGSCNLCKNRDIWRNVFDSMSDIWRWRLHQLSCLTVGGSTTYSHIYIQMSGLAERRRCRWHLIELSVSVAVGIGGLAGDEIAKDKPM